jgi:hypothetical protein
MHSVNNKNIFRPVPRGKGEAFLARIAARFPGLVDPECDRAQNAPTFYADLVEFLREEFSAMAESPQNVDKRLIELARDRARRGAPGRCRA